MIHPLLLACLFLGPLLQDSEDAPASKLTSTALPRGAKRALTPATIEQSAGFLKAFHPDAALGPVEVLLWSGDYSGEKGTKVRGDTGRALKAAGFDHADAPSDRKIEGREIFLCTVTKAARRIRGVWISTNEGALLVWGEEPAAPPPPAAGTFGNVLYTPPKGWTVQAAADSVTLTPHDLTGAEKLFVLLLPGRDYAVKLGDDVPALWKEVCENFQVEGNFWPSEKSEVARSFRGWDYVHIDTTVKQKGAELSLHVYFIHVGGRLERAAILTNWVNQPYKESPARSPKYQDLLQNFVFGLRFKNHEEPALPVPGLKGDGIVGVWTGLSMGTSGSTGRMEWKGTTAAFYTGGLALFTPKLPASAFDGMNPWVQREQARRLWGTWTFEGGRGVLKMPYAEIPIVQDGQDLILTTGKTEHRYRRAREVDGARIDGTYGLLEHNGKVPAITFTEDGGFSDDGAVKVLEHGGYQTYSTGDKPGKGTYEVKNWTLLLHYADGREFSTVFLGAGYQKSDPRPASLMLSFNHDDLKRR